MSKQLALDFSKPLKEKLFNFRNLTNSKLSFLAENLQHLDFSDLAWLSNIEDFYNSKEYLTQRQTEVLQSIYSRCETKSQSFKRATPKGLPKLSKSNTQVSNPRH